MQSVAQRRHPSPGVGEPEHLFDKFLPYQCDKKTAGTNLGNLFTPTAFCCLCSREPSGVRIKHGLISPKDEGLIRQYLK